MTAIRFALSSAPGGPLVSCCRAEKKTHCRRQSRSGFTVNLELQRFRISGDDSNKETRSRRSLWSPTLHRLSWHLQPCSKWIKFTLNINNSLSSFGQTLFVMKLWNTRGLWVFTVPGESSRSLQGRHEATIVGGGGGENLNWRRKHACDRTFVHFFENTSQEKRERGCTWCLQTSRLCKRLEKFLSGERVRAHTHVCTLISFGLKLELELLG